MATLITFNRKICEITGIMAILFSLARSYIVENIKDYLIAGIMATLITFNRNILKLLG